LTGVGVTGIVAWEHWKDSEKWRELRKIAHKGVNDMADELGLPRSKAVTTVKPSGSLSKTMSVKTAVPEGVHRPLGKYIFNNVNFSVHDPIVKVLEAANYHTFPNPYDNTGMLVRLPVSYDEVDFDEVERDGEVLYVTLESAVDQLERYKLLMEEYVDHNCSITVSYSPEEVPQIIDWLDKNWDSYVGVSFIYRNDPTKTAEDLGYPYLPQEVVTKSRFEEYVSQLLPFDLEEGMSTLELQDDECAGGACPVR
jgi:ribonucleoside-triphosphate reductase